MQVKRFDSIQYDRHSDELAATFKTKFEDLESFCNHLEESRAKSLVITRLEEAYMWVGKAIRDCQLKRNAGKQ